MEKSIAAQQAGRQAAGRGEARQTVHRRGSCAVGLGLWLGQPRLVSARLLVSCSYIGYYVHEVVVPKIYASGRKQSSGWGWGVRGVWLTWPACHGLNEDKHSSLALRSCVTSQGGRKWTMTVNGSSRDADTLTHTTIHTQLQ